jgi:riboflavin kinase/FMN adenylyltransferase
MQVAHGIHQLQTVVTKSVVTIGNFDGLHRGHREIISQLLKSAQENDAQSVVVTFHPHPRKILRPEEEHIQLFDFHDQEKELAKMGVDLLVVEPFSRNLSQLKPEQFLVDYIVRPLSPEVLIVGYDFAFGANREGTLNVLKGLCDLHHIQLQVVHPVKMDGLVISSSEIRKSIREGKVELAKKMLGRSFYFHGLVEKGDQRGRQLGFPTANLFTQAEIYPLAGVYATRTLVRGKLYDSVTNVGYNPTFIKEEKNKALKVETHILNFSEDIYGEEIEVHFEKFLRSEQKFSSIEDLISQIKKDIRQAMEALGDNAKNQMV